MKIIRTYLLAVFAFSPIVEATAQTVNCNGLNPWYSTQLYNKGTVIYFNNVQYTANFTTTEGTQPDQNNGAPNSGQPWTITGQCAVPVIPLQVNCTGYPTYSASAVYGNNGPTGANAYAIYNNNLYQAQWWVQGSAPDLNNQNAWIIQGQCLVGSINVTGTLAPFSSFSENPSVSQTIQVGGSNLVAGITVAASSNFEVSLNPTTGYGSSVTVNETNGTAAQTLYMSFMTLPWQGPKVELSPSPVRGLPRKR